MYQNVYILLPDVQRTAGNESMSRIPDLLDYSLVLDIGEHLVDKLYDGFHILLHQTSGSDGRSR